MKKLVLPLVGLLAFSLGAVSLFASKQSNVIQAKATEPQPGDAPTGSESDWAPVTSVSDINTSDFYMLRTTNDGNYQYTNGTLDFVNGVAWRAASFEDAKMFKFVEGTNGYKIKGLFELPPEDLENCHYISIYSNDQPDLWVTDNEEDAAEFNGYEYDTDKITLKLATLDFRLVALPVIYGPNAGECTIVNMGSDDIDFYSDQGFLLPLELVTLASPSLPSVLELKVNDNWASAGARFAAYFYGKAEETTWVDMTLVSGSTQLYEVNVPEGYPNVIFCRMDGSTTENNWDNKWNQTGNLTIDAAGYYLMYDDSWDTGVWYAGKDLVYARGDFSIPEWEIDDKYQLDWNKLSGQYEIENFCAELQEGSVFKIYNKSVGLWLGYESEGMTNDYSLFTEGDTGNIVLTRDTCLDIYYKPLHDLIWIEENATAAAHAFANTFLSTTDGICVDSSKSSGDTNVSTLAAVWNVKETPDGSSLVEKWNALSIGAKSVFAEGTATEAIADAKARYVHIMSRYSEQLTAFDNGPVYLANARFGFDSDLSNDATFIVTIVVVIAISTLTLATILVIKKRRYN